MGPRHGNWLTIRVQLEAGGAADLVHPAGRIMLVGPDHTFRQLADAINAAFARWDLAHLHEFELADGRRIGIPSDEWDDEERPCLDDTTVIVADTVNVSGVEFSYVFDLGDYWLHRCTVQFTEADPSDAYGPPLGPAVPVPIWGWGSIPDQYGRRWDGDTGDNAIETNDFIDLTDPAVVTHTARLVAEPLMAWIEESITTLPARLVAFNEVMADPDQLWLAITHALPHSATFTAFMHTAKPSERDAFLDLIRRSMGAR